MSTSSPVTERTTSGPVTKIRPSGPRITTSVRAGPYAAPPAAGPSTTEICGILPEAWVIAWKIWPTACRDSTPSASRAPPECHRPMIGDPVGQRPLVGVDDDLAADLAHRAAHDGGVGAERDDVGAVDLADGREHAAVVVGRDQLEACPRRRAPPAGGSGCAGPPRGASLAGLARSRGGGHQIAPEGDGDVGAAEAEGVVQRRDVAVRQVAGLGGDVEVDLGVLVVEVDRRRDDPVVQGEHGGDRLEGAGAAEQVPGHRLGAGHHDLGRRGAPSVAWSIRPSAMSPCGVEVAWALTCAIVGGLDVRLAQREHHRAGAAAAGRVGLGDVVGVGGDAGAEHLGVDPGAAGLGVLLGLEHEDAGALAEHEAVAGGVPGPGDRGRVAARRVAVLDSAIMWAKAAIGSGWIAASVPPATHDVGAAEPDLVDGEGDRLVAGGAGGDRRVDRRARADVAG